ncbi:MAG: RNase adapter RapZ [Chromatiales bacterium]|nr:RNase adapter RapZ [Chromatiales bacterium]
MRLVIVSGQSGAGKSVALAALEDGGYYCIDNLPVALLETTARHLSESDGLTERRAAIAIDARNPHQSLAQVPDAIRHLREAGVDTRIVFLQAETSTLLTRFSETRRRHPLSRSEMSLAEAIRREALLLEPFSTNADLRIDTTRMHVHALRELIQSRLVEHDSGLSLLLQSFGFKHGCPQDSDFVFDVRCLPNPHWHPELRALTGRDAAVGAFLEADPEVERMFGDISGFLDRWLPCMRSDARSYLTISLGCTGGQHRSVYMIERLAAYFRDHSVPVLVRHRELL